MVPYPETQSQIKTAGDINWSFCYTTLLIVVSLGKLQLIQTQLPNSDYKSHMSQIEQ